MAIAKRAIDPRYVLAASGDVRVGNLVGVREGRLFVTFADAATSPPGGVAARVALVDGRSAPGLQPGDALLILLEGGDATRPIVVGIVSETLPAAPSPIGPESADCVEVDGRRIELEGREEVVLRCGRASITLRADGQVVLKGTRLTSRASETNKIRGANVLIN